MDTIGIQVHVTMAMDTIDMQVHVTVAMDTIGIQVHVTMAMDTIDMQVHVTVAMDTIDIQVHATMAMDTIDILASNPGPHHFDLLNLREEGLGRLPAIFAAQSGVSVLLFFFFFLFFILPTYHSQSSVTVVCVCELQAADEKNLTPQRHVFSRSAQYIRRTFFFFLFEKACTNPRRELYTSGSRTPSVAKGLRFRSFSIKPIESTRSSSIGFSFSAFFVSPLKQKWHKSVIRNDTKSVTSKLEHVVYLLFDCRWSPTACQSLTFFKTARLCRCSEKPTSCGPVM